MAANYHNQKFKGYTDALRKGKIIQVYAEDVAEIKQRAERAEITISINYGTDIVTIKKEEENESN